MIREGKIVEFRPRSKRFEAPLSLSDFCAQVQQYLFVIIGLQDTLRDACRLFGESAADIWQDQCDRTIKRVQAISEPVEGFYQLLLDTTKIPENAAPFRYTLLMPLHRMNKQGRSLIQLLTEFRAICRKPLKQRTKQRQIIEELLSELMQGCDEVQEKTHVLFEQINQIHPQKRNLAKV